jgi:hypothetical protein
MAEHQEQGQIKHEHFANEFEQRQTPNGESTAQSQSPKNLRPFIPSIRRWEKFYVRALAKFTDETKAIIKLLLSDKDGNVLHTEPATVKIQNGWFACPFTINDIFKDDRKKAKRIASAQATIKVEGSEQELETQKIKVDQSNILQWHKWSNSNTLNDIGEYGVDWKERTRFQLNDDCIETWLIALRLYELNIIEPPRGQKFGENVKTGVELFQRSYALSQGKTPLHRFNRKLTINGVADKNVILALDEACKYEWRLKRIKISVVRKWGYSDNDIKTALEDNADTIKSLSIDLKKPKAIENLRNAVKTRLATEKDDKKRESLIAIEDALQGTISELTVEIDGKSVFTADIFEEKGYSEVKSEQDLRIPVGVYKLTWNDFFQTDSTKTNHYHRLKLFNDQVSSSRGILIHTAFGSQDRHRDSAGCLLIGEKRYINEKVDREFITEQESDLLNELEDIIEQHGVFKATRDKQGNIMEDASKKGYKMKSGRIYNLELEIKEEFEK